MKFFQSPVTLVKVLKEAFPLWRRVEKRSSAWAFGKEGEAAYQAADTPEKKLQFFLASHIKDLECEMADVNAKIKKDNSPCDMEAYCSSEICGKILSMENQTLSQEDFVLLLDTANKHLNNFFTELAEQYQRLKKEDLYYLSLVIIDLSDKQISSLFGVAYNSIRVRRNKICEILGINVKKLNYFLSTKFK